MKRSDLKELIKKSMLEVSPKSGAMTPEEEKMVADYDEEQANKYALDKEEPMEEAMVTPDNRVEFLANALGHVWNMGTGKNKTDLHSMAQSLVDDMFDQESMQESVLREADEIVAAYTKKKTLKEAAPSSANASKIAKLQKERDQIMHDMEQEAEPEGGPVADEYGAMLDKIDAQIRKLKGLKETASIKEEMTGGYLELMEMNPKFDQGIEMLLDVWEEWKSGEMTEPEMIDEAKQDILAYLSSILN
jgi:hypothetical protein